MAMEKQSEISATKILVVDDHPIVRQGLSQLISQETDLLVCGEAANAHEAMALMASNSSRTSRRDFPAC
jgi:YesN/AraC family two-component response regulator